jgi:hypothetical protein
MRTTENRRRWKQAFEKELTEVGRRHAGKDRSEDNLVGLAFSGGGIRSATFGLGVLEGLKHFGLLKKIHYLSTVSGGGYIGAWLSANCKRAADRQALDWLDQDADWTESVAHLRRYSNYLSPEVGFFSADTWSMLTIWLRNTLLVQLTVILAVACVLLLPRLLVPAFQRWPDAGLWRWTTIVLFIVGVVGIAGNQKRVSNQRQVRFLQAKSWPVGLALAAICLGAAWSYGGWVDFHPFSGGRVDYSAAAPIALLLVGAGFCLQPVAVRLVAGLRPGEDSPTQINYSQGWVQAVVVVPMMATGYFVAAILWGETTHGGTLATLHSFGGFFTTAWRYWPFPLSVVFFSLWLLSFCAIHNFQDWKGLTAALLAPFVCVVVLHALLCAIMLLLHRWQQDQSTGLWQAFVWVPALVLFAFALTIVMLIGMMGRQSTEGVREWWSRLGAWLAIYGSAWMIIAVVSVYGPQWVYTVVRDHRWKLLSTAGGWVGTIVAGLFAGHSDSTGGESRTGTTNVILKVVAEVAPFAFIAGLLIAVATTLDLIVSINADGQSWSSIGGSVDHSEFVPVSLAVLGSCATALLVMASRVDINEFSLNAFYRSRLIRCYLGAARFRPGERTPQNFTGFDDDDDIALADLADPKRPSTGPLHIINCALNLGGSGDLALHTRHSASFTLSPLHCGSSYLSRTQSGETQELGYVATKEYGGKFGAPTLGQAISVSGAAASPNMGYHTSPVVAFLLTMFNVRLGWWFPNPAQSATQFPSPHFNLSYLFAELFGGADDKSRFLMISDGGHFENLAVYELVKRKCRVIVVSDAECDPELTFEGLGSVIRMCEVDFGARIILDVGSIRPSGGSTWSSNRCAVGQIVYPDGIVGIIIYLKASMTGHEDTATLQYKASHPHFPHEATSNQFYGEDQFESYRRLGLDVAHRAFATVIDEKDRCREQDVLALAARLLETCSPTLDRIGRFTEHTARLMKLWEQLGTNPSLRSLDKGVVGDSWPEGSPESFRSEFYICSEMIQLMENVYLDLNLEQTWGHPDNKGWQVMFTTWSRSPAIQATWKLTRDIFGRRFQYFCNRHLGLTAGPPEGHSDPSYPLSRT